MKTITLTIPELRQAISMKLNDKGINHMPESIVLNIRGDDGHITEMNLESFESIDVHFSEAEDPYNEDSKGGSG